MELATKVYRVSVKGKQCMKCIYYKRPFCQLTWTYTTAKGYCEDWNGYDSQNDGQGAQGYVRIQAEDLAKQFRKESNRSGSGDSNRIV